MIQKDLDTLRQETTKVEAEIEAIESDDAKKTEELENLQQQ
jgi:hypothetical protein